MVKKNFYPVVDNIIAYESGELSAENMLELFSELVKNGMAWTLQGHYGRTAQSLIEAGYIDDKGNILKDIES
jgi:hypothetical protein